MRRYLALAVAVVLLGVVALPVGAGEARQLWLFYPMNLQVAENIDKAEGIWTRAAKAGYTHVLLTDSKFSRLDVRPKEYFRNAERLKKIAADLHLTIIPAVFPIGYSNDLLGNDPNLAEGLPVKDALFVVHDRQAQLTADPAAPELKKIAFKDDSVAIDGSVATVTGGRPVARFVYKLQLPQYRCYHVAVKIKTDGYTGHPEIHARGGDRELQHQTLPTEPTQDWRQYDVVFNSLDHEEVLLYFGDWSDKVKGTLQWKDWKIEEAGMVNILRRPGTPLVVKGEDGTTYAEGKDFAPVKDPRMGMIPWEGGYEAWHAAPAIQVLNPAIKDGARLRVSWAYPAIIYGEQVSASFTEPKTLELLADQARRIKTLFGAPGYMMSHDEIRTQGWTEDSRKTGKTPGQLLAENARYCRNLLKPATAYVWNDMFDPFHNAVPGPYYLVNGPWTGSWEGLDKDVIIMNWNYDKRDESLKFFADRGHRQVVAGYYDDPELRGKSWLASADKVKGVEGIMYTTWQNDYKKLEAFADDCRPWLKASPTEKK